IKNAIILLHGYGGDNNDISILILNWKRFLPNTIFLCPNGHEPCPINPNGFQWFDLSRDNPKFILEESIKAEVKLKSFIEEIKNEYNLDNSKICLSGFSQGCMMSINIGLTSNENFNCIVGFSGKIIDKENLSKRITSKTKTLLIHGDLDTVVPSNHLLEAKDFLIRNKIDAETKMIKNCDHHIPIEASSIALNYIKKNLSI
ncbi:MAG: dienelactone hydrolase family protein, partial [Candidatus Pelagibacter bacterium]|nr:dienelactone hydrolase family protein [Candidatus Pelagibacter bacterium]